jgi:hypothetical protein
LIDNQVLQEHKLDWPFTILAIISAGSLAAGALRHLHHIWRYQTISGICFTFVKIDAAGDLAAILAISEYIRRIATNVVTALPL